MIQVLVSLFLLGSASLAQALDLSEYSDENLRDLQQSWSSGTQLRGETLRFTLEAPYSLGSGVSPEAPFLPKDDCFIFDRNRIVALDTKGSAEAMVNVTAIKSRKQLYEELGLDLKVMASKKFFGNMGRVEVAGKIGRGFTFSDDNLMIVIQARSDYGRFKIDGLQLKPEKKKLLDQGEFERFAKECGTHYVTTETRVARVAVIITLENVSRETSKDLSGSLDGGVDFSVLTGKASAGFEKARKEATFQGHFGSTVFTQGGAGTEKLARLAMPIDGEGLVDISLLQDGFHEYLATMNQDTAIPHLYSLRPMTIFGWRGDLNFDRIDIPVGQAFLEFEKTEARLIRARTQLENQADYLPQEVIDRYLAFLGDQVRYLQALTHFALPILESGQRGTQIFPKAPPGMEWYKPDLAVQVDQISIGFSEGDPCEKSTRTTRRRYTRRRGTPQSNICVKFSIGQPQWLEDGFKLVVAHPDGEQTLIDIFPEINEQEILQIEFAESFRKDRDPLIHQILQNPRTQVYLEAKLNGAGSQRVLLNPRRFAKR